MLAGAVVVHARAALGAALEVVLAAAGAREERPDRGEMLRRSVVRGARDRQLLVRQIRLLERERQRLERLRGGAQERDELRIAGGAHQRAVTHGGHVDVVP